MPSPAQQKSQRRVSPSSSRRPRKQRSTVVRPPTEIRARVRASSISPSAAVEMVRRMSVTTAAALRSWSSWARDRNSPLMSVKTQRIPATSPESSARMGAATTRTGTAFRPPALSRQVPAQGARAAAASASMATKPSRSAGSTRSVTARPSGSPSPACSSQRRALSLTRTTRPRGSVSRMSSGSRRLRSRIQRRWATWSRAAASAHRGEAGWPRSRRGAARASRAPETDATTLLKRPTPLSIMAAHPPCHLRVHSGAASCRHRTNMSGVGTYRGSGTRFKEQFILSLLLAKGFFTSRQLRKQSE